MSASRFENNASGRDMWLLVTQAALVRVGHLESLPRRMLHTAVAAATADNSCSDDSKR
jgi:hypothetical protein